MATVVACPRCRAPLMVTPELAGKLVACPVCQTPMQLMPQTMASVPVARPPMPGPAMARPGTPVSMQRPQVPAMPPMPARHQAPTHPQPLHAPAPVQSVPATAPVPKFQVTSRSEQVKPVKRRRSSAGSIVSWALLLSLTAGPIVAIWWLRANRQPATVAENPAAAESTSIPPSAAPEATVPGKSPSEIPQRTIASRPSSAASPQVATSSAPPSSAETSSPKVNLPPPRPNILASLAGSWQLPTLAATSVEPMGRLSSSPTDPLELTIRSNSAVLPPTAAIFTERLGDSAAWSVLYVADLGNPDPKVTLGTIRLEETEFSFGWNVPLADAELRRQVANCLLEVRHGNDARFLQLRSWQAEPSLKLDLSKTAQLIEFQVGDLPKLELLRLEISRLDKFANKPTMSSYSVALGKEEKILFGEPAGAEIGVRFQKLATANLAVRLEPVFRENASTEFDMTLPRLDALEKGVSKALLDAQQELPAQQQRGAALQAEYSAVASSPAPNLATASAKQQKLSSLESQIKRAASRITTLQKQIPQHQARLAAVPEIRTFLNSLHQSATIRFRIIAECGDHDLVLVEGTSDKVGLD